MLSAGRAVYVHYFKDIRLGALQSDCVMLLSGTRVPRADTAGIYNQAYFNVVMWV